MATAAAVERLKNGVNAALRTALETPPTGEQLSLARQEELAKETIDAAKEVDSLFEKVKLSRSEESAEDVQREVRFPSHPLLSAIPGATCSMCMRVCVWQLISDVV